MISPKIKSILSMSEMLPKLVYCILHYEPVSRLMAALAEGEKKLLHNNFSS